MVEGSGSVVQLTLRLDLATCYSGWKTVSTFVYVLARPNFSVKLDSNINKKIKSSCSYFQYRITQIGLGQYQIPKYPKQSFLNFYKKITLKHFNIRYFSVSPGKIQLKHRPCNASF